MKVCTEYGKANNKSIYVFSVDRTAGKVAHVNFVPQELVKSKKLDAKIWLEEANKVLGGKVSATKSKSNFGMRGLTLRLQCRVEASPTLPWDPVTTSIRCRKPSSRSWLSTNPRSRVLRVL
jgi:hypothetical protein